MAGEKWLPSEMAEIHTDYGGKNGGDSLLPLFYISFPL